MAGYWKNPKPWPYDGRHATRRLGSIPIILPCSAWVRRYGPDRAASSSIALKIAELERSENAEREKPQGHDRGFLWRMNSYWRYQQTERGVLIECESITLSRSIPSVLGFMLKPLINGVARESMERTLHSLRTRLTAARGPGS